MKKSAIILLLLFFNQILIAQSQNQIQGYWLQEGYGVYLEVSDSTYRIYDVTKISCQQSSSSSFNNWSGTLSTLLDLYSIEEITSESVILKYGITGYKFKRLDSPLKLCENVITSSDDPKLNFDIFWHTFKENYAYSTIREVDWDKIYEIHRPLISENTTDVQLYGYIGEILDAIHDQHISLRVPDKISKAYMKIREVPEETKSGSKEKAKYNYGTMRRMAQENIKKLYGQDKFKSYHKDLLMWGKLNDATGYIQINSMNGYSQDVNIAEKHNPSKYWQKHWAQVFKDIEQGKTLGEYLRGELSGANTMIDSILREFSSTSNLIIDLRFNPGGTDQVAIDILSHFAEEEIKLFTKKIWTGTSSSFQSDVYLSPSGEIFNGEVALLISPQTGSSAEAMTLGSLELSNMVRIGSSTMGIFSDVLQKRLPNGWRFGLSNEIYETSEDENYEYIGIPPSYEMEYSREWAPFYQSIIDLKHTDPAIEKAISLN